ncbi:hypothetical protein P692DRAFT_201807231 [Suillus brevipes Sb2]|nr:hypothetical protein P692DRAFT_201807231 [Suillus brevipes Sb2]
MSSGCKPGSVSRDFNTKAHARRITTEGSSGSGSGLPTAASSSAGASSSAASSSRGSKPFRTGASSKVASSSTIAADTRAGEQSSIEMSKLSMFQESVVAGRAKEMKNHNANN